VQTDVMTSIIWIIATVIDFKMKIVKIVHKGDLDIALNVKIMKSLVSKVYDRKGIQQYNKKHLFTVR